MQERSVKIERGWLHLPIRRSIDSRCYVKFLVDGKQFAELYLGLASDKPDFWCGMELEKYIGKTITMVLDDQGTEVPTGILDGIVEGEAMDRNNPLYPDLYQEALRPQYHFTSRRGWMNDPNGLVFDGKNYHLYYQHNPYGITHGGVNIHWGHAVSDDCLHWVERPDGIRPWVSNCHIASGSCIVDYDGVAGYGKGTIIAAFTHLGSINYRTLDETGAHPRCPSEGQYLAYSTDGGNSFTLFPECPLIPTKDGQRWRDPRIFHDPEGGFGIAVYETTEKGNCVSFYHSDDLHSWERTSRAEDLFECPDLFKLTPINGGEDKWVLYGADGKYRIGDFAKGVFSDDGTRYCLDYGKGTYAGQTWTGCDDSNGRTHICWLLADKTSWVEPSVFPDMGFSQQMTVPCLLKLVSTPEGYRLTRTPIPAVDSLHTGDKALLNIDTTRHAEIDLLLQGDMCLDISCEAPINILCGTAEISYNPLTGEAVFDGGHRSGVLQKKGSLSLRVLTDTTSSEFFLQEEFSASYGQEMAGITLVIRSEKDFTIKGTVVAMMSIWH